jgi:tetratricopeptide (TPR) repeat protein
MEQLLSEITAGQKSETQIREIEAEILKTLSTALSLVGKNSRAIQEGKKAVKLFDLLKDTIGLGVAHANLGNIYFGMALYSEADNEYGKALFYLNNRGKDAAMAGISNNIGNLLMVQNKFDQARTQYENALRTYRQLNIPGGASYTINNIGVINEKQKNYAAATDCYLQALDLDKQQNDLWGQVNGNLNLGDVFTLTGRKQQARKCYKEALGIAEKISDVSGIIRALLALAKQDHENERHNNALKQAQRALELVEKTGNIQNQEDLLSLLTNISIDLGQTKEALGYQKKQLECTHERHQQETLLSNRNAREQTEIRLNDAIDKNKELKNDLSKQNIRIKNIQQLSLGIGAGLILMLLIMLRYIRKKQKQHKIQLSERSRIEQEQVTRQRQKLHATHEELYLEQKWEAQNIRQYLKEISLQLSELHRITSELPAVSNQSGQKMPKSGCKQLQALIEDLMLLINIQHSPREFPPKQNTAEELITKALLRIGVDFKLITQRSGLLLRAQPELFYLMLGNLVEWMEAPYTQTNRPLQALSIELLEPIQGQLPIQLRWDDYDPDLLGDAHQSVLQLSNRLFDWPLGIAGRPTLIALAIAHQSLQQLGGQASMDMPKPVRGLSLQVLIPLQD